MKDAARISEVTTMKKSLKLERIKLVIYEGIQSLNQSLQNIYNLHIRVKK